MTALLSIISKATLYIAACYNSAPHLQRYQRTLVSTALQAAFFLPDSRLTWLYANTPASATPVPATALDRQRWTRTCIFDALHQTRTASQRHAPGGQADSTCTAETTAETANVRRHKRGAPIIFCLDMGF